MISICFRVIRGAIVVQAPRCGIARLALLNAHDNVAVPRPRVLAVEFARPRRSDRDANDTTRSARVSSLAPFFPPAGHRPPSPRTGSAANRPGDWRAAAGRSPRATLRRRSPAARRSIRADRFPRRARGSVEPSLLVPSALARSLFAPESLAQIFFARIGEHRHDHGLFIPLEPPRDFHAGPERRSRR